MHLKAETFLSLQLPPTVGMEEGALTIFALGLAISISIGLSHFHVSRPKVGCIH